MQPLILIIRCLGIKEMVGFQPYAESVRGFKDRFSNTTLAQFQINQDLSFITDGLKLRAMASVRTYTENQNERSFTPFITDLMKHKHHREL